MSPVLLLHILRTFLDSRPAVLLGNYFLRLVSSTLWSLGFLLCCVFRKKWVICAAVEFFQPTSYLFQVGIPRYFFSFWIVSVFFKSKLVVLLALQFSLKSWRFSMNFFGGLIHVPKATSVILFQDRLLFAMHQSGCYRTRSLRFLAVPLCRWEWSRQCLKSFQGPNKTFYGQILHWILILRPFLNLRIFGQLERLSCALCKNSAWKLNRFPFSVLLFSHTLSYAVQRS